MGYHMKKRAFVAEELWKETLERTGFGGMVDSESWSVKENKAGDMFI